MLHLHHLFAVQEGVHIHVGKIVSYVDGEQRITAVKQLAAVIIRCRAGVTSSFEVTCVQNPIDFLESRYPIKRWVTQDP